MPHCAHMARLHPQSAAAAAALPASSSSAAAAALGQVRPPFSGPWGPPAGGWVPHQACDRAWHRTDATTQDWIQDIARETLSIKYKTAEMDNNVFDDIAALELRIVRMEARMDSHMMRVEAQNSEVMRLLRLLAPRPQPPSEPYESWLANQPEPPALP